MIEIYATVVAQIVAFVIWIVRIEMRLRFLEKDHTSCQIERRKCEAATVNKLNELCEHIVELKTDVKWLITNRNGGLKHVENS